MSNLRLYLLFPSLILKGLMEEANLRKEVDSGHAKACEKLVRHFWMLDKSGLN